MCPLVVNILPLTVNFFFNVTVKYILDFIKFGNFVLYELGGRLDQN